MLTDGLIVLALAGLALGAYALARRILPKEDLSRYPAPLPSPHRLYGSPLAMPEAGGGRTPTPQETIHDVGRALAYPAGSQ